MRRGCWQNLLDRCKRCGSSRDLRAILVEPMLIVRRVLREQIVILHRRLLAIVRDDEVCRRMIHTSTTVLSDRRKALWRKGQHP